MGIASLATTGCSYRHGFQTTPAINNIKYKSVCRPAKCDEAGANCRFVSMEVDVCAAKRYKGQAVGTPVSFSVVPGFNL